MAQDNQLGLPEGFALDDQDTAQPAGFEIDEPQALQLPEGFALDQPAEEKIEEPAAEPFAKHKSAFDILTGGCQPEAERPVTPGAPRGAADILSEALFPAESRQAVKETFQTGVGGLGSGVLGLAEAEFRTPTAVARVINTITDTVWEGAYKANRALRGVLAPGAPLPEKAPPNPTRIDPENDLLLTPLNQMADAISDSTKILQSQTLRETAIGKPFYELAKVNERAEAQFTKALEQRDLSELLPILSDTRAWSGFIGQAVPSLTAAYVSGGSIGFLAWMEGMEGASDAADFERRTGQPISDQDFTQAVLQAASINSILEKLGIDRIIKAGKAPGVPAHPPAGSGSGRAGGFTVAGRARAGFCVLTQQ